MKTFIVNDSEIPGRTDIFVASKYPQFTRSSLSALFDNAMVKVNGRVARAAIKLRHKDKVQIDESFLNSTPPNIKLPIVYEDEDVVVINKPAGMLTHAKGALNTEPTIASWLLQHRKEANHNIKLSFPGPGLGNRLGIVHRLDRATSGIIITAKNDKSLKWLQKQFSTRKVNKIYLGVVEGSLVLPEAIIDAPIERNPKKPQTFRIGSQGKPAQTKYKILKNFDKDKKVYSLLDLNPHTGRTHQLRVHLKYIGHPIVGDPVYGRGDGPLLLHSKSLELTLPGGKKKVFAVEPPNFFSDFMNS